MELSTYYKIANLPNQYLWELYRSLHSFDCTRLSCRKCPLGIREENTRYCMYLALKDEIRSRVEESQSV